MTRRLVDDDVMSVPEPWTRCCDAKLRRVETERDEARALLRRVAEARSAGPDYSDADDAVVRYFRALDGGGP